ncbi:MAG: molecular chaperone HtpG [Alphaproteobacteria bacterium]|nr:molecular chaperone HtpG [Alphaproteobacteria bacterium]
MKTKARKPAEEQLDFSADVSRLLDIVANALYSHQDVFLRELISNSSDACDRLRYEAVQNPALARDNGEFHVRVFKNTDTRTLTVVDNGIGMNREELVDNLGTIAKSGTAALMEKMKAASNPGQDPLKMIGQFGVGFYASFMVSDSAEVISRRAGEDAVWRWHSDGRTGYTVREATEEEAARLEGTSGTAITLHIKAGAADFLLEEKIKLVITRYSDHINFPIYLGERKEGEKPVNAVTAIWARPKSDVTDKQYTEFYHHITYSIDEPLKTIHWRAEGTVEFSALLYIPTMRPWDLYDPSRKNAVKLYVRRVFITEQCEGLLYPWLRFLRGVIDSEDLPLNISRESLQFNPVVSRIRKAVARRVLSELQKLAEDDYPAFATFWHQFGAALKEGLYDAYELREEIFKVARFPSTAGDDLTTLADYVARMQDGQEHIYFMSGENLGALRNSPQIEGFRSRGIEVLFMTDTIDDFWLQAVHDFSGKPFRSVTKGSIDLSKFKQDTGEQAPEPSAKPSEDIGKLIETLATILKEDVGTVRLSSRLTESPVCLVAADNEADLNLERVLKIHQKYDAKSKRILEINGSHPLILKLSRLASGEGQDSEDLGDIAHLLLDQARIIQGEPLPDPSCFSRRMAKALEKGLSG